MKNSDTIDILNLSKHVVMDPILAESTKLIFEWANNLGLQGKRVHSLKFIEQSDGRIIGSCTVEWDDED